MHLGDSRSWSKCLDCCHEWKPTPLYSSSSPGASFLVSIHPGVYISSLTPLSLIFTPKSLSDVTNANHQLANHCQSSPCVFHSATHTHTIPPSIQWPQGECTSQLLQNILGCFEKQTDPQPARWETSSHLLVYSHPPQMPATARDYPGQSREFKWGVRCRWKDPSSWTITTASQGMD